tara:strand:- start:274 stop:678 length:405 start_codon:yes stop_codon:yes gene_type:complete
MAKFQSLKTVDVIGSKKKDPCKHLWRTVLSVAVEDAIKSTITRCKFKDFYDGKRSIEIDYVTEPNQDFALVCHYADLDHNLVRNKVIKTLNNIKDNYGNKNMRSLPWQRLYKNGGVERQITKSSKAMSQLPVSG